jgi:hypothetical protein
MANKRCWHEGIKLYYENVFVTIDGPAVDWTWARLTICIPPACLSNLRKLNMNNFAPLVWVDRSMNMMLRDLLPSLRLVLLPTIFNLQYEPPNYLKVQGTIKDLWRPRFQPLQPYPRPYARITFCQEVKLRVWWYLPIWNPVAGRWLDMEVSQVFYARRDRED